MSKFEKKMSLVCCQQTASLYPFINYIHFFGSRLRKIQGWPQQGAYMLPTYGSSKKPSCDILSTSLLMCAYRGQGHITIKQRKIRQNFCTGGNNIVSGVLTTTQCCESLGVFVFRSSKQKYNFKNQCSKRLHGDVIRLFITIYISKRETTDSSQFLLRKAVKII